MKTIKVELPESPAQSYCLHVGSGILKDLPELCCTREYSSVALVIDKNLRDLPWLNIIRTALKAGETEFFEFELPAGEESKTIKCAEGLWQEFKSAGLNRNALTIAVGGGAISDISGFASSLYMRGVKFVNVPTTLLAQVDASIGGKTGINFSSIKNLIGTFSQPAAVVIDSETLTTLPENELNAGFAEAIKHGLINDAKYYKALESGAEKKRDQAFLQEVIIGSCIIKAGVVEKDPSEKGLRKILNFGHTFAHAIESLSHQRGAPYLHGEAVSIGMVAETKLSEYLGNLTHKQANQIEECLKSFNLPVRLAFDVTFEELMEKVRSDKKNTGFKVNWTVLAKIGEAVYDQAISQDQIKEALAYINYVP